MTRSVASIEAPANVNTTMYTMRQLIQLCEVTDQESERKRFARKWLDNPAFRRWFAGSKIVDADGDPLIVFHGTATEFSRFSHVGPEDIRTGGFFFTDDPSYAARHLVGFKGHGEGYLMPSFLSIKNPKVLTPPANEWSVLRHERRYIQQAKEEGHDGIILLGKQPFYVAFHPNQIKSFHNTGGFDTASDDIYEVASLVEARAKPSQALLAVVERWITGWSSPDRAATEAALWAIKDEGKRFVSRTSYGWLCRGQSITEAQADALRQGETIMLAMPRLASWTTHRDIARDYAESADGVGIFIAKQHLQPVLDIARILRFLPQDVDDQGFPPDYVRWAFREGEVVCEHDGPMAVAPEECRLFDDYLGQG